MLHALLLRVPAIGCPNLLPNPVVSALSSLLEWQHRAPSLTLPPAIHSLNRCHSSLGSWALALPVPTARNSKWSPCSSIGAPLPTARALTQRAPQICSQRAPQICSHPLLSHIRARSEVATGAGMSSGLMNSRPGWYSASGTPTGPRNVPPRCWFRVAPGVRPG